MQPPVAVEIISNEIVRMMQNWLVWFMVLAASNKSKQLLL